MVMNDVCTQGIVGGGGGGGGCPPPQQHVPPPPMNEDELQNLPIILFHSALESPFLITYHFYIVA